MSNFTADAPSGYLTIEAAARRLGMRTDALRQRIMRGQVPAQPMLRHRPSQNFGRWVIARRTVNALILRHYAACLAAQTPMERTETEAKASA